MTDIEALHTAVNNAQKGISKLDEEVLAIPGWSSPFVKHFLNNVCSQDDVTYLEVGVWKGSTHVAALYANDHVKSIAIDDFSQDWDDTGYPIDEDKVDKKALKEMQEHSLKHLGRKVKVIDSDYLEAAKKLKKDTYNVYFYDGGHEEEEQEWALTEFLHCLRDEFIYIVDDWNWDYVRKGTLAGIDKANLEVIEYIDLRGEKIGDPDGWWNGIGIYVLRRAQ